MPERKTLNRTYFCRGSSANLPVFTRAKIKSRFERLVNLPSQTLKWWVVRGYFNLLFPTSDLKWGLTSGIYYYKWYLLLVVVWQFLPSKPTLGDRERKKEYCRNSQITRWENCLGKLKKNGQNRELFKRTLHGKVGEAEKKRDSENWREAWVKCSENYEETWTR